MQGISLKLISVGEPPFHSRDSDNFSKTWKFKHVNVSAKYPKSNGKVERTIQNVKQILRKALTDSKDSYLALSLCRTTPVLGSIYSPGEALMNLKLSTILPSLSILKGVKTRLITTIRKSIEIVVLCLNLIEELCPNYNREVLRS
ncbi:hypothetical protein AVEN_155301-1 [Araneus ventricosus]|uniref:Integrase catalytic domain-containing protein n=1 Tax=Araneus ventricosus TaxID=182803 RepID=A0A4Y2D6A0_ARAVE|nr:hypothetical protein AVEN_155301-1 [Araneus ventricosus]